MTNMNEQFKIIHREGKILERFDWEIAKVVTADSTLNGKDMSIGPQ